MQQVRADLWATRPDVHSERLVTHAHLWVTPDAGNIMFHNTGTDADLDHIELLGGIAHQYLSHRDETGSMLLTHAERFGTRLHSSAVEADDVARVRAPDVTFRDRHVDANGVEVIPAPGHSPGSTCFQVTGADDAVYLFTGDTIFHRDGRWRVVLLGQGDPDAMFGTLDVLAELEPDVVASSAFDGITGAYELGDRPWASCVAEARDGLERSLIP